MRCRDVTRMRSAPGGSTASDALAEHLAACPRCAAWADQADRLDRIWAATRPAEPPAEAFDAAWAAARRALVQPEIAPDPARRSSRVALIALAGLAQAAALLVAVWMPWRDRGPTADPAPIASNTSPEPVAAVDEPMPRLDIAEGQISIIHLHGRKVESVELAHYEPSGGVTVDIGLEVFNAFEAMATP